MIDMKYKLAHYSRTGIHGIHIYKALIVRQ